MSENQTLLMLRGESLVWIQPGSGDDYSLSEVAHREALLAELQRAEHQVVFAAPAADIRLLEMSIAPEERRHLDASLPFLLEESLSTDIESLHFARLNLGSDQIGVAVVEQNLMRQWLEVLGDYAQQVPWVPESLLLPRREGEWVMVFERQSALLRYGRCLGARVEHALLEPLLLSLAQESPPQRVIIYGEDEAADRAMLPATLDHPIEWRRGGFASASLLVGDGPLGPNLLQGEFAPRLPYARWWGLWRATAALVLVALVVHLLSGWLDYRRLQRENLALRAEIQAVYRELNPRGAVSDARKQLRQQLNELRGDSGGASFTALLEPLGEAISARDETVLASLNYSRRSEELRVNLLSSDFANVESLREDLAKKGYEAVLENSTRSGDRVRARLRVAAAGVQP